MKPGSDDGTKGSGPREVILVALWLAWVAGLAEAGLHAVRRHVLHRLIWLGPDFPWMTPVGYGLLFAGPALLLAVLALRWPGRARRAAWWLFTFLASFSLLWHVKGVHQAALALVAVGLAVQVTRAASRRPAAASRLVERSTPWLTGAVVALFLVFGAGRRAMEGRRLASLPQASIGAPNIVLVILDTVRAAELDLYGYGRPTAPVLRAFAETGVVFDRAMSPSPSSLPGHAALLTGRLPHEIRASWRTPLEPGVPTLGEVLQDRGYATAAVSGNLFYFTREAGLARGFLHFSGYAVTVGQTVRSTALGQFLVQTLAGLRSGGTFQAPVGWLTEGKPAERVLAEVSDWLDNAPDRPMFLAVNFLDAHRPYRPPEPFRGRFLRGCQSTMSVPDCVTQTRTDLYDGAVAHVDAALGALLDRLAAAGVLDNAVVVVTADHGEHLGERGLLGHGNSLYWPVLHVPLVIRAAGAPGGTRVEAPVSLTDVSKTLAGLAGVETQDLPGRSLDRFWNPEGRPPGSDTLLASARGSINRPATEPLSRGDMYAVLGWPVHYIANGDGNEELYNLELDPLELRDAAPGPLGQILVQPYRAFLESYLAETAGPPR